MQCRAPEAPGGESGGLLNRNVVKRELKSDSLPLNESQAIVAITIISSVFLLSLLMTLTHCHQLIKLSAYCDEHPR